MVKQQYFNGESVLYLETTDLPNELHQFYNNTDISLWQGEITKCIYEFESKKVCEGHYMATYENIGDYIKEIGQYELGA